MSRATALLLVAVLAVAGCASSGSGERGERTDRSVLSEPELEGFSGRTARDVVQRLRPEWLVERPGAAGLGVEQQLVIFLNNSRYGGVASLRDIPADNLARMEFRRSTEQESMTGRRAQVASGTIHIYTRGFIR